MKVPLPDSTGDEVSLADSVIRSEFPTTTTTGNGNMLILTRRTGETLKIGDDVEVTVLGVKGNQVRLGITAPKEVAVHREEVYERIREELTQH